MKIDANMYVGAKPETVLKSVFGYETFRPFQLEIINEVLNKNDILAVMPTGGGKSICYQIPALIMEGITIVVTPLISLMQDQVSSLEANGIHAIFFNSSLSVNEYVDYIKDLKNSKTKILYISPEGLATGKIRDLLCENDIKVSCITVDEAHCISEWGHDFRPDYMEISSVRHYFPDAVMLALTATATDQVRKDISANLKLKHAKVFVSSFNRKNIFLEVKRKSNGLEQIIECLKKHPGDSGIIYCFSRKQVDELTSVLDNMGYSVLNYHAGLSDEIRSKNQELFIKDEVQIMIATVAFGMGINKPNVRFVINYDLPKSLEVYYQEIGRAGRDGLPSYALLLYSLGDVNKIRYFFDEAADPYKSEKLLQGMVNYATSNQCRRLSLLKYFGESYNANKLSDEEKSCCCDICNTDKIKKIDVTTEVQKLLCCIIRTNERFGVHYVVDVLLGSRQKRIIENGHNMISTWGVGKELSKSDWMNLVEMLLLQNYLCKSGDYNVLTITPKGKRLLILREKIVLPIEFAGNIKNQNDDKENTYLSKTNDSNISQMPQYVVHKKKDKIIAEKPEVNDVEAEKIIAELKEWRKRKADDMNVPSYIIFGDKTLLDIAAKKPKNKEELLNVYGMGRVKVENFGKSILNIVSSE